MKSDRSWSYKDRESLKIHSSDSLITFKPNLYSIQREKKNTQKFQMFEIRYKYEKNPAHIHISYLVGGWTYPSEKISVKMGSSSLSRDEHKKIFELPKA